MRLPSVEAISGQRRSMYTAAVRSLWPLCLLSLCLLACADQVEQGERSGEDAPLALSEEIEGLGKQVFLPSEGEAGKADALKGRKGLHRSVDQSETAVWEIENQWADRETVAARAAGLAWGEDSGLNWDEKYALWIASMERRAGYEQGETFTLTTPHGKALPAPSLECAETSLFLRAAFASWHQLPFFVEARDADGSRLYLGHFGFRSEQGRYASSPRFSRYADHRGGFSSPEAARAAWPSDSKLRGRRLGGSQDDEQLFLFEGAHAGAYFDEIFLNKRVGYFMVYLLSYFGSMNLADSANTFNLTPEATREGDTLLHRWQRRGIGHTMVVKQTRRAAEGLSIELISGSMPRRQPLWESASASQYALTAQKAGGPEESRDGVSYARLGGGMKRWRVATLINERWTNIVPPEDEGDFISSQDTAALGARVERYRALMEALSPAKLRETILQRVYDARDHLGRYPASCAARLRREEAFEELYQLEEEHFHGSRSEVDVSYRRIEDYVFAPLEYAESKTCCWNQSTDAMYEIIMDYAAEEQRKATAEGLCVSPTVFRASEGGYQRWLEHAEALGRGEEWAPWSEDERCEQRDQIQDPLVEGWEPSTFCSIELPGESE